MARLIELNVIYSNDLQAGIEAIKKIYTLKMSAQNGEVVGVDTIKRSCCVSSNPDDHIQFAQQYLDLGFDQLYFHTAGPGQDEFLKNFGKDVLPKVNGNSF